jgi:hypothetical protein
MASTPEAEVGVWIRQSRSDLIDYFIVIKLHQRNKNKIMNKKTAQHLLSVA